MLSNVLSRGDKVLVLESGRFAIGWGNAAAAMGAEVEVLKGDWRRAIRPDEVEARLRVDKSHSIKAILVDAEKEIIILRQEFASNPQGLQERLQALAKETRDRCLAVLTNQQRRVWHEMIGDEFKMEYPKIPDTKTDKDTGKKKKKGG